MKTTKCKLKKQYWFIAFQGVIKIGLICLSVFNTIIQHGRLTPAVRGCLSHQPPLHFSINLIQFIWTKCLLFQYKLLVCKTLKKLYYIMLTYDPPPPPIMHPKVNPPSPPLIPILEVRCVTNVWPNFTQSKRGRYFKMNTWIFMMHNASTQMRKVSWKRSQIS